MTCDHITHATDEKLAEMLENEVKAFRILHGIMENAEINKYRESSREEVMERMELYAEAARRLRRTKKVQFNSEAFE